MVPGPSGSWLFSSSSPARPPTSGFFDPVCRVGDVSPPGHVAPEERERWSPWRRVVQCRVNPGEAEGLGDGRYRPRMLALVEQRYAFPEPACRVGEPVEAFQGSL